MNSTEAEEPLELTDLYIEDWIGLKVLEDQKSLHYFTMNGDHMNFDRDWFKENIVNQFLVY